MLFILLGALLAAGPAQWIEANDLPANLRASLAREAEPPRQKFQSADGLWTGEVLSTAAPVMGGAEGKAAAVIESQLAEGEKVGCRIYEDRLYPGSIVFATVKALAESMRIAGVRAADLRGISGSPLLFIDVFYAARDGTSLGELKMAFFTAPYVSIYCSHDAIGYRGAFTRFATTLAETLRKKDFTPAPLLYGALYEQRLGPMLIGYQLGRTVDVGEGSTLDLTFETTLLPLQTGGVRVVDLGRIERRAGDKLTQGDFTAHRDGEWTETTLTPGPEGGFSVKGTQAGKAVEGHVAGKLMPMPVKELLAVAAGQKPAAIWERYSPVQPLEVQRVTIRRGEKSSELLLQAGSAPATRATIDPDGGLRRSVTPLGPLELAVERIWSEGTPR